MKTKSNIYSLLLGALFLLPVVIRAQVHIFYSGGFYYTTNGTGACIVGNYGSGTMIIPSTINGLPVTSIGNSVSFPLATSVIITNSVTSIGDYTFLRCNRLTNIVVGSEVTNIGNSAFYRCANLSEVTVDALNPSYCSVDGILFNKSQTMLLQCPISKAGSYTVPNSVTNIDKHAFSRCDRLTSITIPDSVTSIGDVAFDFCTNLTSIIIPNSVTNIGTSTFAKCTSLTNITLGTGVTSIGKMAFVFCCNLTSVAIPDSVTTIGQEAFAFCPGLTNIMIGPNVATIGDSTFWSCTGLPSIPMPNSLTNIGNYAFFYCTSLTNFAVGCQVANLGTGAFGACASMGGITVAAANATYSSGDGVLFNKSQTTLIQYPLGKAGSYNVPGSVTNIAAFSFSDCSGLTSITMAASISSIGRSAFDGCDNLTSLYFRGNAPSADLTTFIYVTNAAAYYLPATTGWGATFAGVPTALWRPQAQTGDTHFGMQTNQFGFNINWASGQTVVVEACTNLVYPVWQPVRTNTLTSDSAGFSDPQWTNYPGRFYRLRSMP